MSALNPSAWVVVASVAHKPEHLGGWTSMGVQIPTFVLPVTLGLCSENMAREAATSVLNPLGHVVVTSLSVARINP